MGEELILSNTSPIRITCEAGGSGGVDRGHQRATVGTHAQSLGQLRRQRLSGDAEIAAIYVAMSSQFAYHGRDGFCGNSESETDGAAGGRENCRSDADNHTVRGQ